MEKQEFGYSKSTKQLYDYIKASHSFIWVRTYEEARFADDLYDTVAKPQHRQMFTWSCHQGLKLFDPDPTKDTEVINGTTDPMAALARIEKDAKEFVEEEHKAEKAGKVFNPAFHGKIYVLKDFHHHVRGPIPRKLRDMFDVLDGSGHHIIVVAPDVCYGNPERLQPGIEPTLEKQFCVVEFELPTYDEIRETVEETLTNTFSVKTAAPGTSGIGDYTEEDIHRFTIALQGLTANEVSQALLICFAHLDRYDEQRLAAEKQKIIAQSEVLDFISKVPSIDDVGGLDLAKEYLSYYNAQFSAEAKEFGLDPLRGLIYLGIPGTGKSLLAKATAAYWGLPLLRLDIGRVMTGLVGGSEGKMRQAIAQAEAVSPCVLWMDEIEKALGGTGSSNHSDGGTLQRVFGTLLTAMEERMDNIIVVATANDISALPPELIRRFDETLFVELPVGVEREQIFKIHLGKRKRADAAETLDLVPVIEATKGYTGSEVEKVVKEAIARAFRDGMRELTVDDLVSAASDTKPISVVMAEEISFIRNWAKDRARYASSHANNTSKGKVTIGSQKIDIKEAITKDNEVKAAKTSKAKSKLAKVVQG